VILKNHGGSLVYDGVIEKLIASIFGIEIMYQISCCKYFVRDSYSKFRVTPLGVILLRFFTPKGVTLNSPHEIFTVGQIMKLNFGRNKQTNRRRFAFLMLFVLLATVFSYPTPFQPSVSANNAPVSHTPFATNYFRDLKTEIIFNKVSENERRNDFVSPNIVISQAYGGGGNTGATYRQDFIELFNRGNAAQSLNGWSVQYASATGTSWSVTNLTNVSLQPGQYYLVQQAAGTGGTTNLPTPDATGIIAMSGTAGKVALVNNQTALSGQFPTGTGPTIVDFVGYGTTANGFEGTGPTPAPSNTNSVIRALNGCQDTDQNASDFSTTVAFAPGNPRNTASTQNPCSGGAINLSINDVSVTEGNSGSVTATFTVSLSQPAGAGGVTFDIATQDNTATTTDNDYVTRSLTGQTISAGNQTYSFDVTVVGDTTTEPNETFFVNVTNVAGATVSDGQGVGTIVNDDFTITPINQIQGNGNSSPFVGNVVTTSGIVTALRSNGFFIQTPDANVDADPLTSEGVFVFTSSAPPAAAAIGNSVQVGGTVVEFIPSSDPNSPSLTEIGGSPIVTLLSTGNPLSVPIAITAADTTPNGGLFQLEKYEGMRVSVNSLTVVSPTDGNVNETNATSSSNGIFYGVITGINRPSREAGVQVPDPLPLPTPNPNNIPRFDANPERLRIDSDAQTGATTINVTTDAVVTNIVGVLDYGFRAYTILPDAATPPIVTGNISAIAVPAPTATELTVAGFNLERFFDDVNDPTIGEPVLTTTALNNRLNKASLAIRNFLQTPDVIGMVEIENLTTLQTLANKINNDAVVAGQPNPGYTAELIEGNDVGGIDVGFLIKSRVTVVSVTQFGKTDTYINPNTGTAETLNDRPPLRLQATVLDAQNNPFAFTVIVNHLRSLNGIDDTTPNGTGTEGGRVRFKRRAQAEYLANLVQGFQTANPAERIILVGDFNAFQVNDGYVDLMGTIKGAPTAVDQVTLASSDLVNPNLINLSETLSNPLVATNQAYSFIFDGNAQVLDHVLTTQNLQPRTNRFAYARVNADFPETFRNDSTRPERISDHDAAVAYFSLLNPTASTADVGGRIVNEFGHGVSNVLMRLVDTDSGESRYAYTSTFGYYRFEDVPVGTNYIIEPSSKQYGFKPNSQFFFHQEEQTNIDFIALRF
jgi:predicted extracellular nuclease